MPAQWHKTHPVFHAVYNYKLWAKYKTERGKNITWVLGKRYKRLWEGVKCGKVTQRTVSFPAWLPVPLFSNSFALRPGSNTAYTEQQHRSYTSKRNPTFLATGTGERGSCWRMWRKSWKGEGWRKGFSNPVYKAHTNPGLALELHGVKTDPTNPAKALRTENHHPQKARSNLPSQAKWVESKSVSCSVVSSSLQFYGL